MFAPICREIFTLSFEIVVILDWTSPLTVRCEMLPFSGNNQNMNTLPEVMYIMIICHWAILHYNMSFTIPKLEEGLMVISDDFLHFLKIKKKNGWIHQKYLVALRCYYMYLHICWLCLSTFQFFNRIKRLINVMYYYY